MNVFLLPMVLSNCADTPKSTNTEGGGEWRGKKGREESSMDGSNGCMIQGIPSLMSALSVSRTF